MDNTYEKRNDIIYAAVYLFSNNGFIATSVQDIASHCNISKATIYKIFKSKEDILIEIFKHSNRQLLLLVENIQLNPDMSELKKLEEKIFVFFEYLSSKKDLTLMIYQEHSICKGEDFKKIFTDSKFFILNWLKNTLLDAFGNDIKPIIWDMTISLAALIREFTQIFIMKEFIIKDLREISHYIVRNISILIKNNINTEPLLPYEFISTLNVHTGSFFTNELLLEEASMLLKNLKAIVKQSKTIVNKEELNAAIDTLAEEKNSDSPRKFIIDGLFLYLLKYSELEKDILFLKQIYRKL
ncbi:MAG: TetR/AcrR family transcriptional regulator [Sarcina sp.]